MAVRKTVAEQAYEQAECLPEPMAREALGRCAVLTVPLGQALLCQRLLGKRCVLARTRVRASCNQ